MKIFKREGEIQFKESDKKIALENIFQESIAKERIKRNLPAKPGKPPPGPTMPPGCVYAGKTPTPPSPLSWTYLVDYQDRTADLLGANNPRYFASDTETGCTGADGVNFIWTISNTCSATPSCSASISNAVMGTPDPVSFSYTGDIEVLSQDCSVTPLTDIVAGSYTFDIGLS